MRLAIKKLVGYVPASLDLQPDINRLEPRSHFWNR
jgi:hypothetical protein